MEEEGHTDPIDLEHHQHKLNSLNVGDEIQNKLFQSPHILPMLTFVTIYSKYIIHQLDVATLSKDCLELTEFESLEVLLYTYNAIKCDYIDYETLVERFEELFTDTEEFMNLFHIEMRYILNDFTCFTSFINQVKSHFLLFDNPQPTFPNEISIFVYECLISFEMTDIYKLVKLIDDLRLIVHGKQIFSEENMFYQKESLPEQYKNLNMKNYIKSLIINLEKQQNIEVIKAFIKNSDQIFSLLPHLKSYGNYLIKLYNNYTKLDDENNTKFDTKWNEVEFSLLKDPSIEINVKVAKDSLLMLNSNNINAVTTGLRAGTALDSYRSVLPGDSDDHRFLFKRELIRHNFDAVLMQLSRPNLSHHNLQTVVSQLHSMLYYILCSNRRSNDEQFLLHFCFCWNAYVEAKFNCATDLEKITESRGKIEIIDHPDFSHLKNALRSIASFKDSCGEDKSKKRFVDRLRVLDCFLNFYQMIHSFNVLDIDTINHLTKFASDYPDMEPVCRLYRCYYYQAMGFVRSAKVIIVNIVKAENTVRQFSDEFVNSVALSRNYTVSIYDQDDTLYSAYNLWMKIESNLNNLYEMDRVIHMISGETEESEEASSETIVVHLNYERFLHLKTMRKLNQAVLKNDIISFERSLLNMASYYHHSNEYLKHYYYRYALLSDNCKNVIEQLHSSFVFFCANTHFHYGDDEFHISLVDFELLLCNAIVYSKVLRRIGNHFDATRVITECMEKCASINYNKYFLVLIKQLIPFEKIKGCVNKDSFKPLILKYSQFYCEYM